MNYTIYNPTNGQILHTISGTGPSVEINLAGKTYIDGNYSSRSHYIENGQAVVKPDSPGESYVWNHDSKTWELDMTVASASARVRRNILLQAVDRMNPIWYATLTVEQQTELQTYRQQLLDVPQQTGFPENVVWPTKPAWL